MKFCVIGLGRFGYQVATVLADNGMEVMAIDSNESIIASIRDSVTHAICMRITDEHSLRSIGVDEMDAVIVSTAENFAQSILITALLKKRLHIKNVIARAINDIHKEVLELIGADQIILPEKEIGIRLADSLSSPFTDQVRLSNDFSLSLLTAPKKFIGKSLKALSLFEQYGVTCAGIKQDTEIIAADPDYTIVAHDKLLLAGTNEQLERLAKIS
jgi:trk system potassium uptake protein